MAKSKRSKKTKPQEQKKHPGNWEQDLNPHRLGGQNTGRQNSQNLDLRSAAGIKELTECLGHFRDDELAQIAVVSTGSRLQRGAVYLDLRNPAPEPVVATADMTADEHNLYVAKAETPYNYWNRLVGALCSPHGTELTEEMIDTTLADSFPASDPPSWTTGRERH